MSEAVSKQAALEALGKLYTGAYAAGCSPIDGDLVLSERELNGLERILRSFIAQSPDVGAEDVRAYPPTRLGDQQKPFDQAFSGFDVLKGRFATPPLDTIHTSGYLQVVPDTVSVGREDAATSYTLKWIAAPRPPTHPNEMRGCQTFPTFDAALQHMKNQAPDARFVSLTETVSASRDVSARLQSALGDA